MSETKRINHLHVETDEAFKKLFYQFYSPLCNYAVKFVNNKQIAEDLVQDLFIQLWQKNDLTALENPDRYLLRSTKFKCIDYLRTKKINSNFNIEDLPEASQEVSEISEKEIEPLIHYFAAMLPDRTRQVFLLSRQSGLSYRQIAEELDISVKTVENQMGRALRKLRIILKEHNFMTLLPFI